ncbi:MAG: thiolase family protein [Dehalococcoidia bacterium]|nr:thiolase family protein [Dehalococcoidia bacterium]
MAPTQNAPASVYRRKDKLGVWEHRGKVAAVGVGHSPADRRWDGTLETSLGAYSLIAAQKALDDAGVKKEQIDGVVAVPTGLGDAWGPERPYFAPPYDSEDGLSGVSADWLVKNLGLKNVKWTSHGPGCISNAMNVAAQGIGDGMAHTVLVLRATGNNPGRYHQSGTPTADFTKGPQTWEALYGWPGGIPQFGAGFEEYCRKYGTNHDRLAPFVVNLRRNGLMMPEGYYSQHRPDPLTVEDYLASRWISKPMGINDCDMPIQAVACYLVTTAERAKDMKQKPVYILNHGTWASKARSVYQTLAETEEWTDSMAHMMYEGAGIAPKDLDIFNAYDGFTLFTQYFLEAFQWHGVKRGEAHDFYAGDISVEGPHPLLPSGGNNGSGRSRYWHYTDTIQQLQGRAGKRQVNIKAETGLAGGPLPASGNWMMFSNSPD